MPEIALFYGIRITMYYDNHNPPHFHVEYNGKKALIDINDACVLQGSIAVKTTETCVGMVRDPSG